jgi:hypothetical protein
VVLPPAEAVVSLLCAGILSILLSVFASLFVGVPTMGRGNRGGGCEQKPYRQKFLMRQMLLLTEQIEA